MEEATIIFGITYRNGNWLVIVMLAIATMQNRYPENILKIVGKK
ncbi:MAG TPA: hypothetical protein VHJ59_04910 [Nitrososphaera sp.]|jgi:hypothetical protein|nr:hypothetical protein [Nitrososphaera sp.]